MIKMTNEKQRILLVEDNEAYSDKAKEYFASREGVEIVHVSDYNEALAELLNPAIDAVITDCFFPESTGTNSKGLVNIVLDKLVDNMISRYDSQSFLENVSKVVDLDRDLKLQLQAYFLQERYFKDLSEKLGKSNEETRSGENNIKPILGSLKTIDRTKRTDHLRNYLGMVVRPIGASRCSTIELYRKLEKAIEDSESNQPLGILVVEKAIELGKPYIIATSTYHHDDLTQLICDYQRSYNWTEIVDCSNWGKKRETKESIEFWEKAYKELQEQVSKNE